MKGLRDHALIVSQDIGERVGSCRLSAAERRAWTLALALNHAGPTWGGDSSEDGGSVQTLLPSPGGGDVPRCALPFQLGFPYAPNREGGARSHCLALQKEPKQTREGEKGRGGEEEMTAAGQERQHDRGKSQREWKWREWEEGCVAWNVLTFFISQLNWEKKWI